MSEIQSYDTVVVGGGVAGLYCSWKLSRRTPAHKIGLFEGLDRFGGRIETVQFGSFHAEFGPMRFEKPGQRKLMKLLHDLELDTFDFPPYQAERPDYPVYDLRDDEKGPPPFGSRYDTLELMRLGIIRILANTRWCSPGDLNDPRDPRHKEWLGSLEESDYARMRREATHGGEPLYTRGLWDALSDVLSHQALMKIRDLGTFYHLIPENPNAIEWIIFWLRGLNPRDRLVGITGGSDRITQCLLERVQACGDSVHVHPRHRLTALERGPDGGVLLRFARQPAGDEVRVHARHVILALPKRPLKKLSASFTRQTRDDLDAVFGFPLLKCFFLVKNPWWDEHTTPQTRASLMPTREVHYRYDRQEREGLVMLYTDRPATEFWKPFVSGEVHDRAEIDGDRRLVKRFFHYLARDIQLEAEKQPVDALLAAARESPEAFRAKLAEYTAPLEYSSAQGLRKQPQDFDPSMLARARETPSVEALAEELEQRVVQFGIRDWSRDPYGAACHTWRAGARSWEVLERLKAFSLPDAPADQRCVHVCGEAYSDYHGFIEGALRTADDVLETIG